MFKKSLAAVAVAGMLVLGGAAAASAQTQGPSYPPTAMMVVSPNPVGIGTDAIVTVTGVNFSPGESVTIDVTGTSPSGGSLSSIVVAAGKSTSVMKPFVDGVATATFTATSAGVYTLRALTTEGEQLATTTVTVTESAAGAGLPATDGAGPVAAIWLAVGAIGIGGIAIAAATARRRAYRHR